MELINSDLRISGYASLFGQPDLSGDVVQRGAFAASLLGLSGHLPMLFGHETAEPIGVWDRIFEDAAGLFVLTELDLWEVSVVAFPMLRTARITQIDNPDLTSTKRKIA